MADAVDRILEIGDRFEPRLRQALTVALVGLQEKYTDEQILEVLERGGAGGVMALLNTIEQDFYGIRDQLEGAITESGRALIGVLPAEVVLDQAFRFSLVNPNTASYVREYSLNLIRLIAEDTRAGVRQGLIADIASGRNPRDTARTFRQNLGLTPRQELAVRNYRRALETGSADALSRQLRDRRSDSRILRAIESGQPLPKDMIDRLVAKYRKRFIDYRAEVIARTESLRAATVGQRASIRQAAQQQAIDSSRIRRFWIFTTDGRTRDTHRLVSKMNPDGVGIDEPYQTPLGPLLHPRDPNGSGANTIQCRCAERYVLVNPDGTFPHGKPRGFGPAKVAPPYNPKKSRSQLKGPARLKPKSTRKKPAAQPAAATPAPAAGTPLPPDNLRAEFERLHNVAENSGIRGIEQEKARRQASAARVAWARTLPPNELLQEKARVYQEMVRAPGNIDITTKAFQQRFRMASSWVPFNVLEDMRLKGYRVNIKNRLARNPGNPRGFRAYAKARESFVAKNANGTTHAHEFGHLVDTFFSGGNIDRGQWVNRDFVGGALIDGYKPIFNSLRSNVRGEFPNGDGEFWCGPWIKDYEGRIYSRSMRRRSDGLEFWAMNCQRYADYQTSLREFYDEAIAKARNAVDTAKRSGTDFTMLQADLQSLVNEGRENWSARVSGWADVRKRYAGIAPMMENLFSQNFLTRGNA